MEAPPLFVWCEFETGEGVAKHKILAEQGDEPWTPSPEPSSMLSAIRMCYIWIIIYYTSCI